LAKNQHNIRKKLMLKPQLSAVSRKKMTNSMYFCLYI